MNKIKQNALKIAGLIGTLACIGLFINQPSFPTPDKIVVFLTFVFMIFSQGLSMLKRLLPFVVILLAYESFRGVADHLNSHVDYMFAVHADQLLFGGLPTVYLQNLLWQGTVAWYDFVFYLAYMSHFILPLGLAIVVWKTRESYYWHFVTAYLLLSFMAFFTYLIFPAAPPWMASEGHYIEPIVRVSSNVWSALGLHDFPSLYNRLSPNPVAAVPSLHAAWATLFVVFIYKLYGKRWALLSSVYPLLIYVGTVYQGEHYAFDAILGIAYCGVAYKLAPAVLGVSQKLTKATLLKFRRVLD